MSPLEFFDQPPPIPLEYRDRRNHMQRPLHTADYFVFRYHSAGYEECKPVEKLIQLAQTHPNRYLLDDRGQWRCPPGEAFVATYGLTYRVRASDQINWAAQENWLYLEDYYNDLDKLLVPDADLATLYQIVDDYPGITLADLRVAASPVSSDQINIAIARHALYVDLTAHRLTEPGRTSVFRSRETARAYRHRGDRADDQGPSLNRLGTMVLVIGPMRVGKTTLIRLLEHELLLRARERMRSSPGHQPFMSVSATGPGSGRFDWIDYYTAVLRQVNNPFLDRKPAAIRVRDLREAMEEALIQHHPYAVIVDEAHHLAKAASGLTLQDQLDHLKYLENRTGVCHVLVGTYEMRRFRTVTPQLAGRSVDVHFRRYDATKKEDREEFRSVLWALRRQLPLEVEPPLAEQHWEMLYARSIGCIGLLKLHLIRARALALTENAQTITETHLRATAPSEDRVKEMLNAALAGEEDLTEPEGADERLLALLGLRETATIPPTDQASRAARQEQPLPSPGAGGRKPGDRSPGHDGIGADLETEQKDTDERRERAAG